MKKLKSLVSLFTLLLLQSNLQAGSQLTGETKFNDKKIINSSTIVFEFGSDSLDSDEVIRSQVTARDVKPPMLIENRLMDFSAVQIYGTAAPGSGVIIASKNNYYYVLTAKHVIGNLLKGDEIEIKTIDGSFHSAELIKIDEKIDAALIKFKSVNFQFSSFLFGKPPSRNNSRFFFLLISSFFEEIGILLRFILNNCSIILNFHILFFLILDLIQHILF